MRDFWLSCGHHLTDRNEGGGLVVTDAFLKAYFARPELRPPDDAGAIERTLHAALLADPRRPVTRADIAAIEDVDARENWDLMIAFRDHLLRHPTLEAAYVALMREGTRGTPPIFVNQLVHVILRNILDGCEDPWMLRAAELFFRPQVLTVHERSLLAADEETIAGASATPISPLVSMLGLPAASSIDVLSDENGAGYFERSDQFDMALDVTAGRKGLVALAAVIARWVQHILAVEVDVEPLVELSDAQFTWYVGLDAEGTRIGDRLWKGEDLDEATQARVVGVFRLTFRDASVVAEEIDDDPIYLMLAMSSDRVLRMKPQNLVVGLPVRHLETVT
jgi:uncharacterized protein DUF6352